MGEKRGRPRTTLRALRVRGPAQLDASLTQQGIPRHPFREYIAGFSYQEGAAVPVIDVLKNHWPPFTWTHPGIGSFTAETNIAAAAAQIITLPVAPLFDGAGQLCIVGFHAGINFFTQKWLLTLELFTPAGEPYEPSDFNCTVQARSYE